MRLHLRPEPQDEAAPAELGERPGAHRRDGRTARERHRHGSAEPQPARRLGGKRHQHVGIVLGLLDHQPGVADLLEKARIVRHRVQIERNLRRPQAGVDLAQRQQGFQVLQTLDITR